MLSDVEEATIDTIGIPKMLVDMPSMKCNAETIRDLFTEAFFSCHGLVRESRLRRFKDECPNSNITIISTRDDGLVGTFKLHPTCPPVLF